MKHSLKWFQNRIGKRIYRGKGEVCSCEECKKVEEEGLVVYDNQHARYLERVQHELDIDYSDNE